jgi:hypothetical protein
VKDNRYLYILAFGLGAVPLLQSGYFQDNYTIVKWLGIYVLTSILILFSVFGPREFLLPKLPRFVWVLLASLVLIFVGTRFLRTIPLYQSYAFDRAIFVALVFFSFNAFYITLPAISAGKRSAKDSKGGAAPEKKPALFAMALASATSLCVFLPITVYQFLGCRVWAKPPDIETSCFAATTGNANMGAQYVGIAMVFVFFGLSQTKGLLRWFFGVVSVLGLSFIVLSQCRSVILGMGVALLVLFIVRNYIPKKILLAIVACSAVIVLSGNWAQGPEMSARDKTFSTSERHSLLTSVIDLIEDNPLGLGQGGYEFGTVYYRMSTDHPPRTDTVFKSPHNEFLRFVAEDGVAFGLALLALIFTGIIAIWKAWRNPARKWPMAEFVFMLTFGCVFGTEFAFQFPVENAYPFYAWSIFLGFVLSRIFDNSALVNNLRIPPFVCAIAAIIFAVPTSAFVTSKFIEANLPNDIAKTHFACKIDPMNWRVCSDEARAEVEGRVFGPALETMKKELYKRHFNFPILRMWGVLYARIGDIPESCRAFIFYDRMFVEKSDVHQYVAENCKGYPETSAPFREAYESFITKRVQ